MQSSLCRMRLSAHPVAVRYMTIRQAIDNAQGAQVQIMKPDRIDRGILPDSQNIPTRVYLDFFERKVMEEGKRAKVRRATRTATRRLYEDGDDAFELILNMYTKHVPYMGIQKTRMGPRPTLLNERKQVQQITKWFIQNIELLYKKNPSPWRKDPEQKLIPGMRQKLMKFYMQTLRDFNANDTLEKKVDELHARAYEERRGLSQLSSREKTIRKSQDLRSIVPKRLSR